MVSSRIQRFFNNGRAGFTVVAADHQVIWSSPADPDPCSDAVSAYIHALHHGLVDAYVPERDRALSAGETYSTFLNFWFDDRMRTLHLHGEPYQDANGGDVEAVLELVQDVTDQFQRQQRDIGRRVRDATTSVVAHEINNPLAVIFGAVELLLLDNPDSNLKKELETILDQARRIAKAIERLRSESSERIVDQENKLRQTSLHPQDVRP